MHLVKVKNKGAFNFLNTFFIHREINKKYYTIVPEDKYDFRMVETNKIKSDSPRESLAHQINVQNTYMDAIKIGKLKFGSGYNECLFTKSKEELLELLNKSDNQLVKLLSKDENVNMLVAVPWSKSTIKAIDMLWSMNSHEILHTGWNLALMDHLNIERFQELKQVWG